MEQPVRARRVICGVTEGELDQYKTKLLAEGWIIARITPYQDPPHNKTYYRILAVQDENRANDQPSLKQRENDPD